ncbi:radical SAM family heme chaperone HemW [Mucilaginibacter sp. L3T2-6]|uniref:radical SAM family heme chaperone HemW n=1 Tax=Mucilaginibacter sp. L3T2-6 TaxID=3062491 RepID=UPI002676021B|nr:radical SAM family heme chaperone HemW [Mucilaginibacter sp. L3T2-6]MDO3640442.1 radical SAM family heme chaperone HemW [Mucilaginibacter sp. L3T2-6]MDV6213219.1 radical SAM family heme chaperone HemW [Mucilaginibacter sp. L3T2-6]
MAGIYIHIPFCKQACYYCDFHFSTSLKYKDELLQALIKEINLQKTYLAGETIETIYFGGGTPSILSAGELNQLTETITSLHTVGSNAEITIEANPDDLDKAKLQALRQTDINRFSIGIQSFFDDDLTWMNRVHRAAEAEASVKRAQDAGFENITVDLIYGYPLLTEAKWKHNLDKVFELDIPHVSSYSMTVEPQTALASFIKKKKQPAMDEQQSAEQFTILMDAMQNHGFEHYEISNFAKPGHYSRHNSNYWKGVKYLGIGPSAHSFNGETRQWNIANNSKYTQALEKSEVPAEIEVLTENDRLNEYIMTSLRTMWGLDLNNLNAIAKGASDDLIKDAQPFFEKGWVQQSENKITLSREGKLYADHIASELFF